MTAPVSVVIPVHNDPGGILSCLGGLERQGMILEIIVVDDHSTDETRRVAEGQGVRVITPNERGAAAARNTGALAARGEIILFTDADCIPCPGWARNLVGALMEEGVVASKGAYRTRQASLTAWFVQAEYEERYDRMLNAPSVDFLDTYALAVRRADLLAIGGFDEGFRGASVEDQEMSFRLLSRGSFRFVPEAIVQHLHAESPAAYARKKFRIGRGKASLLRRHPSRIRSDSHTPDTLRWQVGAVLLATVLLPLCLAFSSLSFPVALLALSPIWLSGPLIRRARRKHGIAFAPAALGFALIRGWSLALGFAWGVVKPSVRLSRSLAPLGDGGVQGSVPREREAEVEDVIDISS